jgi:hypothetical protein
LSHGASEWVGKDVSQDGIPSQIIPVQSRYDVTTVDSGDVPEIRITRDTGQKAHLYYAFRYVKKPVEVDDTGLKTCIHKIVGGEIPSEFLSPWSNVKIDQQARAELIKNLPPKS